MKPTALALPVLLLLAGGIRAGEEDGPSEKTDQAINKAVRFLTTQQQDDGKIADKGDRNATAMTSLALMAMAAVGHQPTDSSREGQAMKKALAYVLRPDRQDKQGYLGGPDGSRMYGHGIITLMLSEMLGMGVDAKQDDLIRDRLQKAVDLILKAQAVNKNEHNRGGWRYEPRSNDSDLSVTVWEVMALRSARNAGLDVPKEAIDRAVEYIKRCFKKPRREGEPSGCGYQAGRSPEYAMAAAGLLSLQVCGAYDTFEVKSSADWLKAYKLDYNREWFFYGTYYYSQGMYQRGGEHAVHARKTVEEMLLPKQEGEGAWEARHGQERGAGKVYATAMGVLALAVKYHYLPIYQR